ncbi:MAG: hypothetical protein NXH88_11725 [Hyphomonas sp.]|nr:hypothetical protein [Hyphomonas sp.]
MVIVSLRNARATMAVQFAPDMAPEVLDDDFDLLTQCCWMQGSKAGDLSLCLTRIQFRVVLNGLLQGVIGLVGHVVL